jgi:APA family basic amino acid/polyamine antiporter
MMRDPADAGALKREIGLGSALVLVMANMIGTGVFVTPGFIAAELGSAQSLLFCWLAGGLCALAGALCYAELGAMMPQAGGEYVYLRRTFGMLPAFLSGWISLIVGFSAPIAAAAIAFATYLLGGGREPWLVLEAFGRPLVTLSPTTLLAVGVVAALSLVHHHSVRFGQRVQNGLTFFKIGFVLVFVLAGLWWGDGDASRVAGVFSSAVASPFRPEFAVSLIFISFAYSGWNAAAYLGGEIKRPGRNIPLALILGTTAVILLYMLLNLVFVYALPPDAMQGALDIGIKAGSALFGPGVGKLVGLAISFGLLSVISAMIMAGPRVYYAMSCDGVFFKGFCHVNAKGRTPARSILLQGGLAMAMIVSTAFDTLLAYIGFTLALSSVLTVCGLIKMRVTDPDLPRPYRTLGYPFTPLLFIAVNLWIIAYSLFSRPMAGLTGLGTIVLGVLVFKLFHRTEGGPVPEMALSGEAGPKSP